MYKRQVPGNAAATPVGAAASQVGAGATPVGAGALPGEAGAVASCFPRPQGVAEHCCGRQGQAVRIQLVQASQAEHSVHQAVTSDEPESKQPTGKEETAWLTGTSAASRKPTPRAV